MRLLTSLKTSNRTSHPVEAEVGGFREAIMGEEETGEEVGQEELVREEEAEVESVNCAPTSYTSPNSCWNHEQRGR